MNLQQFKRRELEECYVVIYVIKTEVKVMYEERLCKRPFYLLIGINMECRRKYLAYGIKYVDNSDFWLQMLSGIAKRGVKRVLYFSVEQEEHVKRAAEITFSKVKIVGTPFEAIEKISKYFPDNYENKMPEEIKRMYVLENKEELEKQRKSFYLKYEEKKIVKILIEKELNSIDKYYEIHHNIRKLIFAYYFIRDYKKIFKREANKEQIINNVDNFFERFLVMIVEWEKVMYLNKREWYDVIVELMKQFEMEKYL